MQTLTQLAWKTKPHGGLIDETVISNLFPGRSAEARKSLVHRAVTSGELTRLQPGLFCLAPPFGVGMHPFVVASVLHQPSHVSLQSALSFHGLIPEAVRQVSSVTSRRSRRLSTPLGEFTFTRVPTQHPRAGVRSVEVQPGIWTFVAGPLRAIGDLVYLSPSVRFKRDGIRFVVESLRIDPEDLRPLITDDVEEVVSTFRSRRTLEYLVGLARELDA